MQRVRSRTVVTWLGLLTLASALAGCGPASKAGPSGDPTSTAVPPTPAVSTTSTLGSPEREVPPQCRAGDTLAIGRSILDAALGRRFLGIDVRNCTARPLTLSRPVVTGVTGAGGTTTLRIAVAPSANRPDKPFTLGAHRTASAGLSWRAEPRTGHIRGLEIAATDGSPAQDVPLDLLEIRPSTRLDYYPWVARPEDVFS